jgi:hypothetical protein
MSLRVLTSVELHNEMTLDATEVGDERWNRVLAAELGSSALPGTKSLP